MGASLGPRFSGFKIRDPGMGPGLGVRISGFWMRDPGFRFWVSGTGASLEVLGRVEV